MPYANLSEAFQTYGHLTTDTESSYDIRNEESPHDQLGGNPNMSGSPSLSSSDIPLSNIQKIKRTFDVNITDPTDDYPNIAANYLPDGYNLRYSQRDEWDILDPQLRMENAPRNTMIQNSPDSYVQPTRAGVIEPITQQRTNLDKLWDRPTSSEVDRFRLRQRRQETGRDPFGGIGSSPTSHDYRANNQNRRPRMNTQAPNLSSVENFETPQSANQPQCDDQTCTQMIGHILDCPACLSKFRQLLGVDTGATLFGIELPKVNITKVIFWTILIILIVAVYELLNGIFRRLTTG